MFLEHAKGRLGLANLYHTTILVTSVRQGVISKKVEIQLDR
jgi:hypothetical protein